MKIVNSNLEMSKIILVYESKWGHTGPNLHIFILRFSPTKNLRSKRISPEHLILDEFANSTQTLFAVTLLAIP